MEIFSITIAGLTLGVPISVIIFVINWLRKKFVRKRDYGELSKQEIKVIKQSAKLVLKKIEAKIHDIVKNNHTLKEIGEKLEKIEGAVV